MELNGLFKFLSRLSCLLFPGLYVIDKNRGNFGSCYRQFLATITKIPRHCLIDNVVVPFDFVTFRKCSDICERGCSI